MQRGGSVYIMTNVLKTVLYTGVTSNLAKRVQEHKNKAYPSSFTATYNVVYLVYYRHFPSIVAAIKEEKNQRRQQKTKMHADQFNQPAMERPMDRRRKQMVSHLPMATSLLCVHRPANHHQVTFLPTLFQPLAKQ